MRINPSESATKLIFFVKIGKSREIVELRGLDNRFPGNVSGNVLPAPASVDGRGVEEISRGRSSKADLSDRGGSDRGESEDGFHSLHRTELRPPQSGCQSEL